MLGILRGIEICMRNMKSFLADCSVLERSHSLGSGLLDTIDDGESHTANLKKGLAFAHQKSCKRPYVHAHDPHPNG